MEVQRHKKKLHVIIDSRRPQQGSKFDWLCLIDSSQSDLRASFRLPASSSRVCKPVLEIEKYVLLGMYLSNRGLRVGGSPSDPPSSSAFCRKHSLLFLCSRFLPLF